MSDCNDPREGFANHRDCQRPDCCDRPTTTDAPGWTEEWVSADGKCWLATGGDARFVGAPTFGGTAMTRIDGN